MTTELDVSADVIDVRDVIARFEELEATALPTMNLETGEASYPNDAEPAQRDVEELALLTAVLADLAGNGGGEEWRGDWYPVTLVRDSYFTSYVEELVEDVGDVPDDFPSWIVIDWNATARNVQTDYTSTEIDGTTYWYR